MFVKHNNYMPKIDKTATICPGVIISGDVNIGAYTVIMEGAIIKAEGAPVSIGKNCVIMEHAVLRGAGIHSCILEDMVLVGPHSHICGAIVKSGSFIATGATLFNGAVLEKGTTVAVNGIVHINTYLPSSSFVPISHIAIGNPAQIYSTDKAPEVHKKLFEYGFTKTVYNFDSANMTNEEATKELCKKYTNALRKKHQTDQIIN